VVKLNPGDMPILVVAAFGTRPYAEITDYAENVLTDQLQTIRGVGDIMSGLRRRREVRLWVRAGELEARGLGVEDVVSAVGRQHLELPAGRIESQDIEFNLRTMGEFRSVDELNRLVVAQRNGTPILLQDVAVVEDGLQDKRIVGRYNQLPSAGLLVRKQRGANTVAVARAVKKKLQLIEKQLPEGIQLAIAFDSSRFIEECIAEIQFALLLAIVLTALITHVFLLSLRSTVIIALAMPVSIVGTFAFMYFLGFTLNTLTLLGLSLSVGIVVDDAIIFLENIYRHLEEGEERQRAAVLGSRQIAFAALAATLSIVAIFTPVAFMRGLIGRFFYEFGITVSVTVLLSYIFAVTLTPMLCSRWLRVGKAPDPVSHAIDTFISGLVPFYSGVLRFALRWRWAVLVAAVTVFVLSLGLLGQLGKEFVPSEDQSLLLLHLRTPVGSSIDYTDEMLRRCEEIVGHTPEVKGYFGAVGLGMGQASAANRGIMFISLHLKDQRTRGQDEIQRHFREEIGKIPGMFAFVQDLSGMGLSASGRGYPIEFELKGPELEGIERNAHEMMERMRATRGLMDVDSNYEVGMPEVRIVPDRQQAADRGVDMAALNGAIQMLFGGMDVGKYKEKGKRYDIRVRLTAEERRAPLDIGNIRLKGRNGQLVPIRDLIDIRETPSLVMVNRSDRQRSIKITANVGGGVKQAEAMESVQGIAKSILPEGYHIEFAGGSEQFVETFQSLVFALALGIVVSYMVLAAQYDHFVHPLTIMVSIPFSITGALGILWLTGHTLNLYSMIGILLLMGLVGKNAILLVDFTNQLRQGGMSCRDALLQACPLRVRPVLMTTISTIAGALPIVIGVGPGAESRTPMAIAVIGGLVASTLLTLLVVPVVYEMFDGIVAFFRRGREL
jgi:hydrophobe/amphiphile efflux-1 (HAE1) family protein